MFKSFRGEFFVVIVNGKHVVHDDQDVLSKFENQTKGEYKGSVKFYLHGGCRLYKMKWIVTYSLSSTK